MNRAALIDKLNRATDRAASLAISKCIPMKISKDTVLVGKTIVRRNSEDLYDVVLNKTIIYKNITVFDVAIIIAQRYNSSEFKIVRKVLALEETYDKHHTDMIHYLSCLKGAKQRKDIERMAILEDKFQVAEIYAKVARDSISAFKRIK